VLPRPLAVFKGPTSKGRERRGRTREGERGERKEKGMRGDGRVRREQGKGKREGPLTQIPGSAPARW